jgi:hypothetical protein
MPRSPAILFAGAVAFAGLSACTTTEQRASGAGVGAVTGAAVAGPAGAVVGGVTGAVTGPTVAKATGVPTTARKKKKKTTH